jgi:cell shape-determining protein MreC
MTAYLVLAVVVFLIFVVVGLRFGSPAVVSPVKYFFVDLTGYLQIGLSGPSRWGKKFWRSYLALQDVELENKALRQEVVQLQKEIGRYREALIANARYKRLLDYCGSGSQRRDKAGNGGYVRSGCCRPDNGNFPPF